MIAAGVFAVLVAPLMSRLIVLFPPVVTGSIIMVIGISLMHIGIGWAEGPFKVPNIVDGQFKGVIDNPNRDSLDGFALSLLVLIVILGLTKYGKGFLANISVLLGIVAGAIVAALLGKMSFGAVGVGGLFWRRHAVPVRPARLPARADRHDVRRDDRGDDRIDRHVPRARRHDRQEDRTRRHHARLARRWRRHDHRRHPQRLSLYVVLAERWAGRCHRHSLAFCRGGGRPDPVVLSLVPKLAAIVAAVPVEVLGGAGIVMFGMVAATGVRILGGVDFRNNRNNLFIVAIGVGAGLIPLIAPAFFKNFPIALKPILDSGIILTTVVAVILNAYYNGLGSTEAVEGQLADAARAADH